MARADTTKASTKKPLVVIGGVICVALLLLIATVALRPQTIWTTDGDDLGDSLRRAGPGFAVPEGCHLTRLPDSVWRCPVEDDVGSGISGVYRLTLGPDDCWTAYRPRSSGSEPQSLKGCVNALDYLWP